MIEGRMREEECGEEGFMKRGIEIIKSKLWVIDEKLGFKIVEMGEWDIKIILKRWRIDLGNEMELFEVIEKLKIKDFKMEGKMREKVEDEKWDKSEEGGDGVLDVKKGESIRKIDDIIEVRIIREVEVKEREDDDGGGWKKEKKEEI